MAELYLLFRYRSVVMNQNLNDAARRYVPLSVLFDMLGYCMPVLSVIPTSELLNVIPSILGNNITCCSCFDVLSIFERNFHCSMRNV